MAFEAQDRTELLAAVEQRPVDANVGDIHMPGVSGIATEFMLYSKRSRI